ncbi:TetR/AcrR family transcriptional regulator [Rhizobium sp. SSA_523]|uniref:TetR/AcrR family transcriptional regulator n=1 Tax=Rhizobium sp. SSA_523 TaxID=2952477 RepID=UPI0020910555|nr:TetR/AcrR family transcriptional regulator [Rhizobium sp. SSA_523]MCO5733084.1 TetR family transcriptional regulator [Rhizobium sp. SSA_523]WKC23962.1 TetR/AcrR family transcriptional regulator [Rhizobium sp. SSA_523]
MDGLINKTTEAKTGASRFSLRRIPKQDRSRERIDEILKVAMDLIGKKGIDAVTMKEIASLSGGPIASVYQYFPNKSAIVATLHDSYVKQVKQLLSQALQNIRSTEDIAPAAGGLVDLYMFFVSNNPAVQDLINAAQADKMLSDMDVTAAREVAEEFSSATEGFIAESLRPQYGRTVFMMCHLTISLVRLILKVSPEEGKALLKDFKSFIGLQLSYYIPDVDHQPGRRKVG